VNSEMTNELACFMTDLAGQRPNRLSGALLRSLVELRRALRHASLALLLAVPCVGLA
jgi:hypothetical protein